MSAKRLEYTVEIDRAGRPTAAGETLELGPEWTAEHLVLAGLWRCSLTSLRFVLGKIGADAVGSGSAAGVITKREEDDRYAFVEVECRLDVQVEPAPPADELPGLLAQAERYCFIGASLTARPTYRWSVNGAAVDAA